MLDVWDAYCGYLGSNSHIARAYMYFASTGRRYPRGYPSAEAVLRGILGADYGRMEQVHPDFVFVAEYIIMLSNAVASGKFIDWRGDPDADGKLDRILRHGVLGLSKGDRCGVGHGQPDGYLRQGQVPAGSEGDIHRDRRHPLRHDSGRREQDVRDAGRGAPCRAQILARHHEGGAPSLRGGIVHGVLGQDHGRDADHGGVRGGRVPRPPRLEVPRGIFHHGRLHCGAGRPGDRGAHPPGLRPGGYGRSVDHLMFDPGAHPPQDVQDRGMGQGGGPSAQA